VTFLRTAAVGAAPQSDGRAFLSTYLVKLHRGSRGDRWCSSGPIPGEARADRKEPDYFLLADQNTGVLTVSTGEK
jgi:hypothetical protein